MNSHLKLVLTALTVSSFSVLLSVWCLSAAAAEIAFKLIVIDQQPPTNPWTKIVADFNGDGRPDIAIGGQSGPLVWYVNPGWKGSIIADGGYATVNGEAADVDGDGRLDVVLSPAEPQGRVGRVAWYEAPLDPKATGWTEHIVAHEIETVIHGLGVADLDSDGQPDVVAAQMHQGADPDEVMIFRNGGKGLDEANPFNERLA